MEHLPKNYWAGGESPSGIPEPEEFTKEDRRPTEESTEFKDNFKCLPGPGGTC